MTRIIRRATAGTLESSDVFVELEPGGGAVEIEIQSAVYRQFGETIRETAAGTLRALGVDSARLSVNDRGALDCVLCARIETAVRRAAEV